MILFGIFTIKKTRTRRSSVVWNIKNVIAENIEMFTYEPINLTKSNCKLSDGLINLCSKGPSFIPIRNTFD